MAISYTTLVRNGDEPKYTFAEVKYGKIVSINEHWVPLEEYVKFFNANALFIDITGVEFDGEKPQIGDVVTTDENGYQIKHDKGVYSPAEVKAYTVELMKLTRDQKELEPIELAVDGTVYLFDADKDAMTRMAKARQLLEDTELPSIVWTTFDNQHVSLNVSNFKELNIAQAIRSTALHDRYNQLKNYIYALDDKDISVLLNGFSWDTAEV